MIPSNTPFKVIRYLGVLSEAKELHKNYNNDSVIIFLLDREYIEDAGNKFKALDRFNLFFIEQIQPLLYKHNLFVKKLELESIVNYVTLGELEILKSIASTKEQISKDNLSHQQILSKYFGSSKHTKINSSLSKAIKKILAIDSFIEDNKDQQYISILYPFKESKIIILCENKNRLLLRRHEFIEFWFTGGRNTKQLEFIPTPKLPIFYLFDWDYDGLLIYIDIQKRYFKSIKPLIPEDVDRLKTNQEDVKEHKSEWKGKAILNFLSDEEKGIVENLIESNAIIEEQKIMITVDLIQYNTRIYNLNTKNIF